MWTYEVDRTPFAGIPSRTCTGIDRYATRGWQVVAATELEFYLVDDSHENLSPPINPQSGRPLVGRAYMSLRQLDSFDAYFSELYDACELMGIDAQTAISEAGLGQFEVNLTHSEAMRAADDTWLFKSLVRGLARKHGMAATFMAKPFAQEAGNGMHVHFSVLDEEGNNIFDNGGADGTAMLRHAVAGCLEAMAASTLVFAPMAIVTNVWCPTRTPRQAQVGPMKIAHRPFVFQKAIPKRGGSNTVLQGGYQSLSCPICDPRSGLGRYRR